MRIVCGVSNHNNKTNNNYLQKKKMYELFFLINYWTFQAFEFHAISRGVTAKG